MSIETTSKCRIHPGSPSSNGLLPIFTARIASTLGGRSINSSPNRSLSAIVGTLEHCPHDLRNDLPYGESGLVNPPWFYLRNYAINSHGPSRSRRFPSSSDRGGHWIPRDGCVRAPEQRNRLAILLALWEEYDPLQSDQTLTFSELFDRVGVPDSGNFNYHLTKLTDHFVEETANGYRLQNAGLKVVQATIAGTGLNEKRLPPTELDMSCYRCGAPVELSYKRENLYHVCSECEGNSGPELGEERPSGTLMMFDFNPAGLANRDPDEIFLAGTVKSLRDFGSLMRGICPECSGAIETAVHICNDHTAPPGEVCSSCGTGDEVRISYVCTVCKHGDSYPGHAAVYDHPAVVAFCHKHGIKSTFELDDPESCCDLWDHLLERECILVSEHPVRIRITIPGNDERLHLTIDEELTVMSVDLEQPDDSSVASTVTPGLVFRDEPSISRQEDSQDVSANGILPDHTACLRTIRRERWPNGVICPHCQSEQTVKKGTTSKDAQRYRCRGCQRIFNDLTGTIFSGHRLSLPEMVYIIENIDTEKTKQIARDLDRSYKTVLDFSNKIEENIGGVQGRVLQ